MVIDSIDFSSDDWILKYYNISWYKLRYINHKTIQVCVHVNLLVIVGIYTDSYNNFLLSYLYLTFILSKVLSKCERKSQKFGLNSFFDCFKSINNPCSRKKYIQFTKRKTYTLPIHIKFYIHDLTSIVLVLLLLLISHFQMVTITDYFCIETTYICILYIQIHTFLLLLLCIWKNLSISFSRYGAQSV